MDNQFNPELINEQLAADNKHLLGGNPLDKLMENAETAMAEAKPKEPMSPQQKVEFLQKTVAELDKEAETTDSTDAEKIEKFKEATAKAAQKLDDLNTEDTRKSVEELKKKSKEQAVAALRELSAENHAEAIDGDEILKINASGLIAVQKYLGTTKLDSDDIIKKLGKMPLRKLAEILPKPFMDLYSSEKEIAMNSIKSRERLISSLAYLTVTGPEMDYLNDYIDNEHRLIAISNRLMKIQVDSIDLTNNKEQLAEVIQKANELCEPDKTFWRLHIDNPKRIGSTYAQKAVVSRMYRDEYVKVLEEYPLITPESFRDEAIADLQSKEKEVDDYTINNRIIMEMEFRPEARKLIQEQIDECDIKESVYLNITKLELMKSLWDTLTQRLRIDKRNNYQNLMREAVAAMDRICRAKQNVVFPICDAKLVRKPADLTSLYLEKYPEALRAYNKAIHNVLDRHPGEATDVEPIEIDGISEELVYHYMSLYLLILYGRIMKALGSKGKSAYDTFLLETYFDVLCQLATDVYVMNDVWLMMKDFIEYSIKTWPKTELKGKKRRK